MTLETAKIILILATSLLFVAVGISIVYMVIASINDDRKR